MCLIARVIWNRQDAVDDQVTNKRLVKRPKGVNGSRWLDYARSGVRRDRTLWG